MEKTPTDDYNYADDNTSAYADNIKDLLEKLEKGSAEALKWLDVNNMLANADKFKLIILQKPALKRANNISNENITLSIGNEQIKPKPDVKLLGLKIDENLNFKIICKRYICAKRQEQN
jgi:hypothetical protein